MLDLIISRDGQRKYLSSSEVRHFISVASEFEPDTLTLCWTLSATGCRISEALSFTPRSIDRTERMITIESLKKRRRGVYRSVPVPAELIDLLVEVHHLNRPIRQSEAAALLWPISRMTAYRRVRRVMDRAGLSGLHAMPKGLRHGFGVAAIQTQVPLNLVQRWLGHADMRTTAIYAAATGPEERSIALRMWRKTMPTPPDAPSRAGD